MQLFQKDQRSKVKEDHPEVVAPSEITKLLSEAWKAAPANIKAPYEARAKVIVERAAKAFDMHALSTSWYFWHITVPLDPL